MKYLSASTKPACLGLGKAEDPSSSLEIENCQFNTDATGWDHCMRVSLCMGLTDKVPLNENGGVITNQ